MLNVHGLVRVVSVKEPRFTGKLYIIEAVLEDVEWNPNGQGLERTDLYDACMLIYNEEELLMWTEIITPNSKLEIRWALLEGAAPDKSWMKYKIRLYPNPKYTIPR